MSTVLSAFNPEISSVASNAAVELDRMIHGDSVELAAVSQLGDLLNQALEKSAPNQPAKRLLVDTEMEAILGQAFANTGADPETIVNELMQKTEEKAQQLSNARSQDQRSYLEALRDFCLALHECASAYRQMAFDVRPPHPNRR